MQFVALRYRALGEPRKEAETFDALASAAAAEGKRGAMINALANLSRTAISSGEISEGEAYAKRVEALVQEARGSPNPRWRAAYEIYGRSYEADAAGGRPCRPKSTVNTRKRKPFIDARRRFVAPA
jgi:hypothetical protein